MKEGYDIKWHNISDEMPGTDYDYSKSIFCEFLLRYTYEDSDRDCWYEIGRLINGKFLLNFDDKSKKDRKECREEARILHWAYIDHPKDYDENA